MVNFKRQQLRKFQLEQQRLIREISFEEKQEPYGTNTVAICLTCQFAAIFINLILCMFTLQNIITLKTRKLF